MMGNDVSSSNEDSENSNISNNKQQPAASSNNNKNRYKTKTINQKTYSQEQDCVGHHGIGPTLCEAAWWWC
jgi:hypothetical protein